MAQRYYYYKSPLGREAIKLRTINVIEFANGEFQQIRSFSDTPEGNQRAEKVFTRLLKEHTKGDGIVMDKEDIAATVEEGYYDDKSGYQIFLIHST